MPTSLHIRVFASLLAVILLSGCAGPVRDTVVKRSTVAPTAVPEVAETPSGAQAESREPAAVEPAATLASEAPAVEPAATPAPKPPRGTWGLEVGSGVQPQAIDAVPIALNGASIPSETVLDEADLRLSAESADDAELAWERAWSP